MTRMTKYHCRKCDIHFFERSVDMNQRHRRCGEFAKVEWGTEYEGVEQGEVGEE